MKNVNSLKRAIYNAINEAIDPRDYMMYSNDMSMDEKKSKSGSDTKDSKESDAKASNKRREKVLSFLKSAQQKHSEYAYHLWPDMEEDDARSLFSKKYRGHDAEGKPYSFDDDEINVIYNMIDDVLEKTKW